MAEQPPPPQLRIRVRRRDGGAFEPARTIASFAREGDFGGADVAVGPRGEIAVMWAAGGSLVAHVQEPRARRFGARLRVGRSDRLAKVAAAFTTGGRLVTIWSSADGGEEQNRPAIVRIALRRAGAMRFARAHKLGVGAAREPLALARGTAVRAVGAGSTAMVVWTSGTLRTRIASVTAAGTVTRARTIDPDGVLVDAVGSTSRRVLVAWTHDPSGAGASAQAVIAPPGRRFGPGAPVGPAGSWATGAALDPRGHARDRHLGRRGPGGPLGPRRAAGCPECRRGQRQRLWVERRGSDARSHSRRPTRATQPARAGLADVPLLSRSKRRRRRCGGRTTAAAGSTRHPTQRS